MKCHGKYQRAICVFSVRDLPNLDRSRHMFANKFQKDNHPLAYDCMERRVFRKVFSEDNGNRPLDEKYYKQLDYVCNHI